jgi:class 3 adenylate cyclase
MSNTIDPKAFSSLLAALMKQQPNVSGLNKLPSISAPMTIAVPVMPESSSLQAVMRALSTPKPIARAPRLGLGTSRPSRLQDELQTEIKKIFRERWTKRDGQKVPDPEDLGLGNDSVKLDATVLYADMSGSTNLVDNFKAEFAAEVYKAYLASAARIIKDQGGTITAYDGDRIMAVFIGDFKNTNAATAALKVNWAVKKLINPSLQAQYSGGSYQMSHTIGVDTSEIFASRIGVRNDNDIVWVGRAANYAAKLTELDEGYPVYLTGDVFDRLHEDARLGGTPRRPMWESRTWTKMHNMRVYRSNWTWSI